MASVFISCPSCSATDEVVRTAKALPNISAISALTAVKHGSYSLHRLSTRYAPENH
ncbi:IS1 family transposase [Klebsiella pneumoniae]|uniref:IS1 family transposase n=1 Tax=Klebsiella pneumoniae TaxID=573 RepID=UPI00388F3F59